ncbi:Hypothetical protein D9617_15g044030 [Elsinoe fawcettii]|nr:Hypothetical protein D9617_15g044030 [Elsinoe fawcettii]
MPDHNSDTSASLSPTLTSRPMDLPLPPSTPPPPPSDKTAHTTRISHTLPYSATDHPHWTFTHPHTFLITRLPNSQAQIHYFSPTATWVTDLCLPLTDLRTISTFRSLGTFRLPVTHATLERWLRRMVPIDSAAMDFGAQVVGGLAPFGARVATSAVEGPLATTAIAGDTDDEEEEISEGWVLADGDDGASDDGGGSGRSETPVVEVSLFTAMADSADPLAEEETRVKWRWSKPWSPYLKAGRWRSRLEKVVEDAGWNAGVGWTLLVRRDQGNDS